MILLIINIKNKFILMVYFYTTIFHQCNKYIIKNYNIYRLSYKILLVPTKFNDGGYYKINYTTNKLELYIVICM